MDLAPEQSPWTDRVPDRFIPHGSHEQLLKEAGLSPELITERILETFGRKNR